MSDVLEFDVKRTFPSVCIRKMETKEEGKESFEFTIFSAWKESFEEYLKDNNIKFEFLTEEDNGWYTRYLIYT